MGDFLTKIKRATMLAFSNLSTAIPEIITNTAKHFSVEHRSRSSAIFLLQTAFQIPSHSFYCDSNTNSYNFTRKIKQGTA